MSEEPKKPLTAEEVNARFALSPYIVGLGMRVESVDHERQEIVCRLPLTPALERRKGTRQFHGGAIAALIDVTGDFAIGMLVGGGVPTINLRVDYLRPAIGASLAAAARVRRSGRTVAVVDIDVTDEEKKLVAVGRGTYSPQVG